MNIKTLTFVEKDGQPEIVENEQEELTDDQMIDRMSKSFALLSIDRIILKNRKNYDPAVLSQKIGIGE
ncbi:MAG: hypothetical protein LBD59_10735 [Prevotellaceae bacterium]|jgi:hypothetical protein|nr:hypothetical protein [Prevotellaceae bacterium]